MRAARQGQFRSILGLVYLSWNLAAVGLSVLIAVRTSLRVYSAGTPVRQFSLQNYKDLATPLFIETLAATLRLAAVVAALATVLALLLVLSVWSFKSVRAGQAVLLGLASVYFAGVVPRTQAMVFLLSPEGPLHSVVAMLGSAGKGLLYTQQGIAIGFLPILLPLATAVVALFRYFVPESYLDAARDMGATERDVTMRIVIPLLLPGLVICGILCFVLVLGDVVVVDLLGGSQVYTVASHVVDRFKVNDWGQASAVAVVVLAIVGALLGVATAAISRVIGEI